MALLMDGYEADTVSFLFRLFDQAGCFVDVGANIGLISLPFTRLVLDKGGAKAVGRSTPIAYSIEPVRSNYETLAGNIELNGSGQWVRPLYVGVGEREKTVEIAVEGNLCDGEGTGTANVVATGSPYVCERILLHVTTIDTLVRTGQVSPKVTLLKLDTDGYDLFALMGAARLLSETRPVVFGEFMAACMKWHGQTIADVAAFAGQAGYETFVRVSKTWRFTPLIEPEAFVQDLLLVPREKKDQVLWCLA
jgi:FkbM family methyltransferase